MRLRSLIRHPPPPLTIPILTYEDLPASLDRLEQELGKMRALDRTIVWDDIDRAPTVSSFSGFQMPNIKPFGGIGCPRAHLRLYSLVMGALCRDDTQLVCPISIIL